MGVAIRGWGTALPPKVLTNADLEATLDTDDTWIVERTGIRERRVGGSTGSLAVEAGGAALRASGADPGSVDLVLLATCTPDALLPATACLVQHELGTTGGAVDLNAACSGFVYGLATAAGLLDTGLQRVLLVGAEAMSRIIDWDDRNTAVLFGDGAGAVVLDAVDGPGALLGFDLGSDGSGAHLLRCEHGGTLTMDGREVFRRAVRIMVESAERALERAGLTAADVDVLVPHQANERIIEAAAQRLGIPSDRTVLVLDRTGNTSAASIPLALADAAAAGRLTGGEVVLLVGFGAGMSWASAVLRWDAPIPAPSEPLEEALA